MKVRAKQVDDKTGLHVVCGNCGFRLATLVAAGRIVDDPIPFVCPQCGAEVDRQSGDNEK